MNPLLNTLFPTAAGRQFGQNGNFTSKLTERPAAATGPMSEAPMKFRNLARAFSQAGADN